MIEPDCFIDTSIIVRYLTRDVEPLASHAGALIAAVEREEIVAELSATVVLETIHAMTTIYAADRTALADGLLSLLDLSNLVMPDKSRVIEALQLWRAVRRLSFADAYHLVLTSHSSHRRIASFDKGMDRCLAGITRFEEFP